MQYKFQFWDHVVVPELRTAKREVRKAEKETTKARKQLQQKLQKVKGQ